MARRKRSRKNRLAKLLLFAVLEVGALAGVPMRPDQIEALLRMMNGTQIVDVMRRESAGEPPHPPEVPP